MVGEAVAVSGNWTLSFSPPPVDAMTMPTPPAVPRRAMAARATRGLFNGYLVCL